MNHPITPPPELVEQWFEASVLEGRITYDEFNFANLAARWGADTELEACCEYMQHEDFHGFAKELRAARRPEPPSLKAQALERLAWIDEKLEAPLLNHCDAIHTIRRALEALDD